MTTNTTNSQTESIDTREFRLLLADLFDTEGQGEDAYSAARAPLIAHIDAKLAQAGDDWRDRAYVLEARLGEVMEKRDELRERAIAAESRLAEIQRGVEGLKAWLVNSGYQGVDIEAVSRDEVLALLQPQGQASESKP